MAKPSDEEIIAERVREAVSTTFGTLYHYHPSFDAYRAVNDVITAENVQNMVEVITQIILDKHTT